MRDVAGNRELPGSRDKRGCIRSARELVVLVTVNLYPEAISASSRIDVARAQLETANVLQRQASNLKTSGLFAGIDVSVPLTTISMDAVPRERMGNATSLFNLMRNLGGSIGIAVTGTMLARQQQAYTNVLGSHVTPFSAQARHLLDSLYQGFIAAGADPVTATQRAYAAAFGAVQRQAAMLSFVDLFRGLGLIFVCLVPLVLLMKRPRTQASAPAAH